jgi:isocitrate dehydrogenase
MTSTQRIPITVAHGDGIGPEIMREVLRILDAAGAQIDIEEIEVGEQVYRRGFTAGLEPSAWDSLRRTKVFLKAPITTPQGGGYKSLNVTIRKTLGLYANVRPCVTYEPAIRTAQSGINLVVIRENEEDLYAGIEHRQTDEAYQCLKLLTRPGSEKIVRYAFEYAKAHGRRKVTCMTKDNIMKLTDGMFHRVFDEIGAEYPDIEKDHRIIDIGMARVATRPQTFDVIVIPNLYGDILSDVAAEVAGSVGLAPSVNIGDGLAMFEAIHGSAPDIAGQDIANPSGLLLAAVMMLVHIGQPEVAEKVHNAWLRTIESGVHTADIYNEESERKVGTRGFADAVIESLGTLPERLRPVKYEASRPLMIPAPVRREPQHKELVGVDVFFEWRDSADGLAQRISGAAGEVAELQMITNRGVKVWPGGMPETTTVDHWRCRFMFKSPQALQEVVGLLSRLAETGAPFIKTEHLYTFDGEPGFSLGQGQ